MRSNTEVVEDRREHRREVHRQPIQQQESDDRRSQSLGLAEWSAERHVKCNSILARLSAWNIMYALVLSLFLSCPIDNIPVI